jgi:hypothetical protein
MKLKIIVGALLLSVIVPLLISCSSNSNADTYLPRVNYSVIVSGDQPISGLQNRKLEVYTDQAAFNSSLYLYIQPLTEQSVDFSSRRVILLSLGAMPTGSYSISVDKIENYGKFIKASIIISQPGSNCAVTQASTSPYQFVEVESIKPLIFEERVEDGSCNIEKICINFPPPSFCPGGTDDIVVTGTDSNGCSIYGCKE